MLEQLWTTPWWTYDPWTSGPWGMAYRWFNIAEGCIWIGCAVFVVRRWLKGGRGWLDVPYALLFLMFGLTDFREASVQSAPLVLVKGILLLGLFLLRRHLLPRYTPGSWV